MGQYFLGVDIGSVSISAVVTDLQGQLITCSYRYHHGMMQTALKQVMQPLFLQYSIGAVAVTNGAQGFVRGDLVCDDVLAFINSCKQLHPDVRSLLMIGGEKFGLVAFDEKGNYTSLAPSSSCAAGTGSFLDQQAGRLKLKNSAALAELALTNTGEPPKIASRCSVFAKTDLIHAQASGYRLEEICDGLCQGLVHNVLDTVLREKKIPSPLYVAGGVAQNGAVLKHLERITGTEALVDELSVFYGAYGATIELRQKYPEAIPIKKWCWEDLIVSRADQKEYYYAPLSLTLSQYPDFISESSFIHTTSFQNMQIEVDIYRLEKGNSSVYLGIDIGSTSTKAMLVDSDRQAIAGFYTRTAGQPLEAVQALLQTIEAVGIQNEINWEIRGVGTTGSGRKFISELIGADLSLDEITAHARAAYALDPEVDTIIEIGGQDAKFTTLRNGMVTFSQMNSVCAAGTGSFIEEQASRLGVPLKDFAERASGVRSPLTSDRCTVFMERDINHYLNQNYSVEEILAGSLMSVRENYLLKVAVENAIGDHVCFQGATAKNKALVAAFEQRLEKPIAVSAYCHLTGAMGVALTLLDEGRANNSSFRGLSLYQEQIPLRTEVCELCNNHCRIRIAEVKGETVAFGFLCGRDYETKRFIDKQPKGFRLLKERKKVERRCFPLPQDSKRGREQIVIGIPAALHLVENLSFWKYFFRCLGISTLVSEKASDVITIGKQLAGAEFCAPMSALHGHVEWLSARTQLIFLPIILNGRYSDTDKGEDRCRKNCYYTQYAPSVVSLAFKTQTVEFIMPLLNYQYSTFNTVQELYRALKAYCPDISMVEVGFAYYEATQKNHQYQQDLQAIYQTHQEEDAVQVMLTGRPYTVLSEMMNKKIPNMFENLGVKTFYQDMINPLDADTEPIKPLLNAFHWDQASRVLETAAFCVRKKNLYPVLITSFKCSPDSFAIEYFKRILDQHGKPYLILQLDEHDSNVGYETRVEAAVRAFNNHYQAQQRKEPLFKTKREALAINPVLTEQLKGKTILFPAWDSLTLPMIAAHLNKHGYDVRFLEEDAQSIQKSMRHNTGQCIPLNAIAQEFIDYIRLHDLKPADTVLWLINSVVSCNVRLYPHYIKTILESHGLKEAGVYIGNVSLMDIVPLGGVDTYFAFFFGGLLRSLGCRNRPYELEAGATDRAILAGRDILVQVFSEGKDKETALEEVYQLFAAIPTDRSIKRPLVAIFGDFYVRDNEIMNQNLIKAIEDAGGEALTTSFSDLMRITSKAYFKRMRATGQYKNFLMFAAMLRVVELMERKYYGVLQRMQQNIIESNPNFEAFQAKFNIRVEQEGESYDNILKIFHIMQEHPEVALFVQANPAFCCPSLITEAMCKEIEQITGVPVVSITYDGTGSYKNGLLAPYLRYSRSSINPDIEVLNA